MANIKLYALGLILAAGTMSAGAEERKPNIVLIMADDLGWTDLGCTGSKYYETPNLDKLASQGMKWQRYYTCQNCAPTRAALMSGQYAPRTGIYTVGTLERGRDADRKMVPPKNGTNLPLEKITVANALKKGGYVTGMFGKWHLGNAKEYHPGQRGFDEAIVCDGRHFDFPTTPKTETKPGEYLADFLTDRAVDFIERQRDKPFFLYLPHFGVHSPLQAKADKIAKFQQKPTVGGHNNAVYAGMIESVDDSVGRIMAKLDELKLAEHTLLIFTSDNGGLGGYPVPGTDQRKGTTDNFPLRGGKGMLYEGGVRVPFIVRWPGHTTAGSLCHTPAMCIDLYPTFLDAAGAPADPQHKLDGVSLASLFRNPQADLSRPALFWHMPGYLEAYIKEDTWRTTPVSVIQAGDFKLLEYLEGPRLELYNIREDLGQTQNLASEMPDKVRELHAQLQSWQTSTNALMPRPKTEKELANPNQSPAKKKRAKQAK